jgi:hypothetical protein
MTSQAAVGADAGGDGGSHGEVKSGLVLCV